jgi:Domain of unknown function (DUF1843)
MATSKKTSKAASKSSPAGKTGGSGASLAASIKSGAVPPYGEAIRQASARGEVQEMQKVAAAARQWLKDVQSALDKLDQSLQKSPK